MQNPCHTPFILTLCIWVIAGCEPAPEPASDESSGLSTELSAEDTNESIANHLLEAEHSATPTNALSRHFTEMDRETAYDIQLLTLASEQSNGKHLIGWKMGGTRVADPTGSPDPSFAYILHSDSLQDGEQLSTDAYIGDSVLVEAEVAFIIGQDLPGPEITESQLIDAIESVAGAIELISVRLQPTPDGTAPTTNHMIAARLSHAGVIVGEKRIPLSEFDLENESVVTRIDGTEKAAGRSSQIMNTHPLDALLWLANALPEHGLHLRTGDVVITGSLYANPTLKAGQEAVVQFSSLGALSVSMAN